MFRASFALLCFKTPTLKRENGTKRNGTEENVNPRWNIVFFSHCSSSSLQTPQSERSFEIICSGDDFGNSCSKLFMLTNVDNTIFYAVERRFVANTLTHAIYANACTRRDKCKWRAKKNKTGMDHNFSCQQMQSFAFTDIIYCTRKWGAIFLVVSRFEIWRTFCFPHFWVAHFLSNFFLFLFIFISFDFFLFETRLQREHIDRK